MGAVLTALPLAALDSHLAILGIQGSGKTYGAKGEVEHLLSAGRRVCVIDPTGVWWGLRLGRAGDAQGGFPVVIFGGDHADVPITGKSGVKLAQLVADGRFSCIIDVVRLTVADRTRLFADFAEQLAMQNRRPLHLVIDEAHLFAPQGASVQDPLNARMVGAANHLVSGGRALGLRVMLLTQRPAKLHKDSLTQVQTLVAMRVISPQDREAVKAWIGDWVQAELGANVLKALPTLKTGTGFVWAPTQSILSEIHFRPIKTFDSSRTPEHDDDDTAFVHLATLPLDDLRAALMEETTPGVVAKTSVKAPAPSAETLKAEWDKGFREGYERAYGDARQALDFVLRNSTSPQRPILEEQSPPIEPTLAGVESVPKPAPKRKPKAPDFGEMSEAAASLHWAARTAPRQVTWAEAAILAGRIPQGGYFEKARRELKDLGFLEPLDNDQWSHSDLNIADLWERLASKFDGKGRAGAIFRLFLDAGPMTREQAAARLGVQARGGHWETSWRAIRKTPLCRQLPDGRHDVAQILRELVEARS